MKTERLKNSIYNGLSNLIVNISITILSFIIRTYFIKILGEQCLGLDGLFTNILSFLSLSELGISTAISYSLYKPLAEGNQEKINRIMTFYRKVYQYIAFFILGFSIILLPFLHVMVKGYDVHYNIYLIYSLYVINTVMSYFTSYKITLIDADQRGYKLTTIKIIFNILTYGLQLVILLTTKNLILYLIIQVVFRQLERIVTNLYINKKYPNVNFKSKEKIDKEDSDKIKENVKGIIFHKVGDYTINGTDHILISSIVNIATTGIYSNYLSIISVIRNLIGSVVAAATSSYGNLNVSDTPQTKLNIFNIMDFACFFATGLFAVGIYFLINTFITLWIGTAYTLNQFCIIIITLNFYLNAMLLPVDTVKNSTGQYYVDRFVPIIQAFINIVLSVLLGHFMGLAGILLATTISYLTTISWSKAFIIYKYVFHSPVQMYLKKQIKNISVVLITILLSSFIFKYITISNLLLLFIIKGCIVSILFVILFLVFYHQSNELAFFYQLVQKKLNKKQ